MTVLVVVTIDQALISMLGVGLSHWHTQLYLPLLETGTEYLKNIKLECETCHGDQQDS